MGTTILDLSLRALKPWSDLQGKRIIEFLLHVLENKELDEAQAVVCIDISKLMLSGKVSNEWVRPHWDWQPKLIYAPSPQWV